MKQTRARYSPGDRVEGTIDRILPGGVGLLRGQNGVVLVERAAPGDRVIVEIQPAQRGAVRGTIADIIESGPGRIDPPCKWYGTCGGCDFQHLDAATQIEAKRDIVLDALERIGGITCPHEIPAYPAPQPFGARTRVELHASDDGGQIGFYGRRTHTIVPIDHCIVSSDEIDRTLPLLHRSVPPYPGSLQLLSGNGSVHADPAFPPIEGGPFWLRIGDFDYLADPAAFFQSSLDLLPALIQRVVDSADGGELVWDLFCGAGLFAIPLAKRFARSLGVDLDPRTIGNAEKAAQRNGIGNASFVTSDVLPWITNRRRRTVRPDLVVVDPPRAGLDRALAHNLSERGLRRMTYVSCDPTTLARDLRILSGGNLRMVDIAIFDLFPQTHHVETVVRLAAD